MIFISFFIFLRSSYISDTLKKVILPELELAINKKVTADKIYINFLPIFIGINELKVYDEDGKTFFHSGNIKGYIGFFQLFNKTIAIKKLVIKEPDISIQKKELDEIITSIKKPLKGEAQKTFQLIIKSVQIRDGNISLKNEGYNLSLKSLNSDVLIANNPEVRLSSEKVLFAKDNVLNIDGKIGLHFVIKNNNIDLKSLNFSVNDSEVKTTGSFDIGKSSGELKTEINLLIDSVKRMFGLINKGEGFLSAKGSIKAIDLKSDFRDIYLDLKVKGHFYLETLMELLKVKEKLEGKLSVDGEVSGQLKDIRGDANAELQKGNLFGVEIDRLNCRVAYADRKMKFTEGVATLYGGSANAEVTINLPVVDYFTLKVEAKDVSSKAIFKLIKWDPNIPEGKVTGEILSSGRIFNPDGSFIYKSSSNGNDILGRIKEIRGQFSMKDKFISFSELAFQSPKSNLRATGAVDLNNNKLNFTGAGNTTDLIDLTSPYFASISGAGKYNVLLHGNFTDPSVDIAFASEHLSFTTANIGASDILKDKTFTCNSIKTAFTYNKSNLALREFYFNHKDGSYSAKGNIYFKKAAKLFELKQPDYDLSIVVKNADIESIAGTIHKFPEFKGFLNANFNMKGFPDDLRFTGDFNAKKFVYEKNLADTIQGKFSYAKRQFLIPSASIRKGDSSLNLTGNIALDKRFVVNAEGSRIKMGDIIPGSLTEKYKANFLNELYLNNLTIRGSGTLDSPYLDINGKISGANSRAGSFGKGNIDSKIAGDEASVNISMMDGRFTLTGRVRLDEKMAWSAAATFKPANYAPFVASFFKDLPEDIMLNLTGNIYGSGDRDNTNIDVSLNRAYLHLYSIWLVNSSDILVNVKNKDIIIKNFSMKGDDTELSLSGNLSIGKNYNLEFEGTSSVAPIKAIFKEIETLRGKAYFTASLTGPWDKPKIDGGIDLSDGTLALKNIPYRMSSISAYLYVDENKIIVKNINGKIAGGDVFAFGTIYLQGLEIKNFFIESRLTELTLSASKDLWASLDGVLYYRGSMKSQELSGDVNIKKAKYSQRVEWKSWLLKARKAETPKPDMSRIGQTALNIRIKGENLIINNNIADTMAKMDLILRGIVSRPVLLGKADTDKGIVYFRNNEFRVLKARVDFIDPEKTTPYFDILAETKVKNYLIKLHLDGNFEHFDLTLSSDPHLNEGDIFSLLTVGNIGKQMKGLEGGIGTGEASLFLAGKLQDVLEERVRTVTGLDRIQIDPQVSKTTGTVTPRLTVSKKIMGDKLLVTYSASVGTGEEQIWKLEYIFDKNISFVLVRDERATVGGDVKFRFEFK